MRLFRASFALCLLLCGCGSGKAGKELLFFCGSAVKMPMDEIIRDYQAEKGVKVSVIYGGSGGLLSQMETSGKGDIYLSGSPDFIIIGERKGLLLQGTDRRVAYLIPAIIVPKGNPQKVGSLADLARKGLRIGIGNPKTVCLGLYSIELLDINRLLEKTLPNVAVYARSCEDVAMLPVMGAVDAVIGWDVFKTWNPDKVDLIPIDASAIPRLAYVPIALAATVRDRVAAEDFISYVVSPKGAATFRKWGYITDEAEARRRAPRSSMGGEYALPEAYMKSVYPE